MSTLTMKSLLRDIADEAPMEPDVQNLIVAALPFLPPDDAARVVDLIVDWGGEFDPEVDTVLRAHPDDKVRFKAWQRSFQRVTDAEWAERAVKETNFLIREIMLLAAPVNPGDELCALTDVATLANGPDNPADQLLYLLPREHGWAVVNAVKALPAVPDSQALTPGVLRLVEFRNVADILDDAQMPALYRLLLASGAFAPAGHVPAAIAAIRAEVEAGLYELTAPAVSSVVELALNAMADAPVGRSADRRALLEFGFAGALSLHSAWGQHGDELAAEFESRERHSVSGLAEWVAQEEPTSTLTRAVQIEALWEQVPPHERTDSWCATVLEVGSIQVVQRVLEHLGDRACDALQAAIDSTVRDQAPRWLLFVDPDQWCAEARELDGDRLKRQVVCFEIGKGLSAREVVEQHRQAAIVAEALRTDLLEHHEAWTTRTAGEVAAALELSVEDYSRLPLRIVRSAGWDTKHGAARTALMNAFLAAAVPDAPVMPTAAGVQSTSHPQLTRAVRLAALDAMLSNGQGDLLLSDLQMVHIV